MTKSKAYYRHKADRILQQLGKDAFDSCEVCGQPMSCMHHYFPKSMAGGLRYEWDNLIPICQSCHFSHHNGNPVIHATILAKRGQAWHDRLLEIKKKYVQSDTIGYYKGIIESLSKIV